MLGDFQYDVQAVSRELRIRSEILEKLLLSFSKTLSDKISQLDVLVPSNSVEQIRAIMHEVKGTSGNLRLKNVYESADKMHVAVKAGEAPEVILADFEEFKTYAHQFIEHIQST